MRSDVDQRRHHAHQPLRQDAVEEVDVDVVVLAHADRGADEHGADQQVARDLLGPDGRVVERVAREELVEDRRRRAPRRSRTRASPRSDRCARSIGSSWTSNSPLAVSTCSCGPSARVSLLRSLRCDATALRSAVISFARRCSSCAGSASPRHPCGGASPRARRRHRDFDRGHHRAVLRDRGVPEVRRVEVVFEPQEERARALVPERAHDQRQRAVAAAPRRSRRWKRRSLSSGITARVAIALHRRRAPPPCARICAWARLSSPPAPRTRIRSASARAISSKGPESAGSGSACAPPAARRVTYTPEPTRTST